MNAKYSFYPPGRFTPWIACLECERGVNGSDPDKCPSGSRIGTAPRFGCFQGKLMDGLTVPWPGGRRKNG
jgi:hypothetical protein